MENPTCPKGCRSNVARLAGTESHNKYQCGQFDCLHEWMVPMKGVGRVLPDLSKVEGDDVNCAKCGKKFEKAGAWKDKHEAKCTGGGNDGSVEEDPDMPVKTAKRRGKAPGGLNGLTEATESMITALKAKRDTLIAEIPELAKLDQAIAALESLK